MSPKKLLYILVILSFTAFSIYVLFNYRKLGQNEALGGAGGASSSSDTPTPEPQKTPFQLYLTTLLADRGQASVIFDDIARKFDNEACSKDIVLPITGNNITISAMPLINLIHVSVIPEAKKREFITIILLVFPDQLWGISCQFRI